MRMCSLRFCRLVSTWVIVSFLGSLIICCELFSTGAHAADSSHTKITRAGLHDHSILHDHGLGHDHSLSSSSDGQVCATKYLPKFDTLRTLGGKSFDEKPFILTFQDDPEISSTPSAQTGESFLEVHMGSPPLYLLFHRLLIAHTLA